jgi:hypothetical protein
MKTVHSKCSSFLTGMIVELGYSTAMVENVGRVEVFSSNGGKCQKSLFGHVLCI